MYASLCMFWTLVNEYPIQFCSLFSCHFKFVTVQRHGNTHDMHLQTPCFIYIWSMHLCFLVNHPRSPWLVYMLMPFDIKIRIFVNNTTWFVGKFTLTGTELRRNSKTIGLCSYCWDSSWTTSSPTIDSALHLFGTTESTCRMMPPYDLQIHFTIRWIMSSILCHFASWYDFTCACRCC